MYITTITTCPGLPWVPSLDTGLRGPITSIRCAGPFPQPPLTERECRDLLAARWPGLEYASHESHEEPDPAAGPGHFDGHTGYIE